MKNYICMSTINVNNTLSDSLLRLPRAESLSILQTPYLNYTYCMYTGCGQDFLSGGKFNFHLYSTYIIIHDSCSPIRVRQKKGVARDTQLIAIVHAQLLIMRNKDGLRRLAMDITLISSLCTRLAGHFMND